MSDYLDKIREQSLDFLCIDHLQSTLAIHSNGGEIHLELLDFSDSKFRSSRAVILTSLLQHHLAFGPRAALLPPN